MKQKPTKGRKVKAWKRWACITNYKNIGIVSSNGWDMYLGIFNRREEAYNAMRENNDIVEVIKVLITPLPPNPRKKGKK